jgi:hypothetical protein
VAIFGEQHLRHLLSAYQQYYNESRTHLSLKKDAPIPRDAQGGTRACLANLGRITPSLYPSLKFRQAQTQKGCGHFLSLSHGQRASLHLLHPARASRRIGSAYASVRPLRTKM